MLSKSGSSSLEAEKGVTKPWWRAYEMTLAAVFLFALIVGHQELFLRANPPPQFEQLRSETVEVLAWQRLYPQLQVRLSNGQVRWVEFPSLSLRRDDYKVMPFDAQRQLVGATCLMAGRPLSFTWQDRYQIFHLNCVGGRGLEFDESIRRYAQSYRSGISFFWRFGIHLYLFAVGLVFWAESVRNRKLSREIEK